MSEFRTEGLSELFYNDRLDKPQLSTEDYPARIDQAALDLQYGISVGKSKKKGLGPLGGVIQAIDFGVATGKFYKEGLESIAGPNSQLIDNVDLVNDVHLGDLAYRLNEAKHKLEKEQNGHADGAYLIEGIVEKLLNRAIRTSEISVYRETFRRPETVSELLNQLISDPEFEAYAGQLIDTLLGESLGGQNLVGVLDSPEMVTPLWDHQREAIEVWVEHDMMGYVDMATATGKTVLGLAAIATLYGSLHPADDGSITAETPVANRSDRKARVLVVAGQKLLLEQWRSEVDEHFNIPRDRTEPEIVDGIQRLSLDWGNIEFRTAGDLAASDLVGSYDLVILDEAHRYRRGRTSGRGWRDVIRRLTDSAGAVLAMSGSIDEGWLGDESIKRALAENLMLCKEFSVPEARQAGVIADFTWEIHYSYSEQDATVEKIARTTKMLQEAYDDDRHKFRVDLIDDDLTDIVPFETLRDLRSFAQTNDGAIARDRSRAFDKLATAANSRRPLYWQLTPPPDVAADLVARHAPESKVIVLTESYRQASRIGKYVEARIGDELVLVPESGSGHQFEAIQQFNEGEYRVIVGPGSVLGVGVDMPDAEVAINLAKGGVNASLIQRIGRVLRNPSGNKDAKFYHIVTIPHDQKAYLFGEDGRRFLRRAAEYRALGSRMHELPEYSYTGEWTINTLGRLESSGKDALIADRRSIDETVDDEVAANHLRRLLSVLESDSTAEGSTLIKLFGAETLDRTTDPYEDISGELDVDPTESDFKIDIEQDESITAKTSREDTEYEWIDIADTEDSNESNDVGDTEDDGYYSGEDTLF